ncbi:hypothetical protein J6497_36825 [Bradyrhizobium sp. CNPSo 4026]|nr:hypothetical protein [Bradyrhizobium cenepequi]
MRLVKTSAIACALSALLVGPVLAQGLSADTTKLRSGLQGKKTQGTMSDDEVLTTHPGAVGGKAGMKSTKSTKGATGTTGTAPSKATVDDSATGGSGERD